MKTSEKEREVVIITSTSSSAGSRDAVETAIGISKGNRFTTWESVVRGSWNGIKQWDSSDESHEPEKRAARER